MRQRNQKKEGQPQAVALATGWMIMPFTKIESMQKAANLEQKILNVFHLDFLN